MPWEDPTRATSAENLDIGPENVRIERAKAKEKGQQVVVGNAEVNITVPNAQRRCIKKAATSAKRQEARKEAAKGHGAAKAKETFMVCRRLGDSAAMRQTHGPHKSMRRRFVA